MAESYAAAMVAPPPEELASSANQDLEADTGASSALAQETAPKIDSSAGLSEATDSTTLTSKVEISDDDRSAYEVFRTKFDHLCKLSGLDAIKPDNEGVRRHAFKISSGFELTCSRKVGFDEPEAQRWMTVAGVGDDDLLFTEIIQLPAKPEQASSTVFWVGGAYDTKGPELMVRLAGYIAHLDSCISSVEATDLALGATRKQWPPLGDLPWVGPAINILNRPKFAIAALAALVVSISGIAAATVSGERDNGVNVAVSEQPDDIIQPEVNVDGAVIYVERPPEEQRAIEIATAEAGIPPFHMSNIYPYFMKAKLIIDCGRGKVNQTSGIDALIDGIRSRQIPYYKDPGLGKNEKHLLGKVCDGGEVSTFYRPYVDNITKHFIRNAVEDYKQQKNPADYAG